MYLVILLLGLLGLDGCLASLLEVRLEILGQRLEVILQFGHVFAFQLHAPLQRNQKLATEKRTLAAQSNPHRRHKPM